MRQVCVWMMAAALVPAVAGAQSSAGSQRSTAAATPDVGSGYIEGVAQSTVSNVTSQFYGAEAGVYVYRGLQVYAEFGRIRDVATADLSASAAQVAGVIGTRAPGQSTTTYSVKEPVTFFAAGVRYPIPIQAKVEPYVLGGLGVAQVKNDVTFSVNGVDVTGSLSQAPYFITLGGDVSGSQTKPILVYGGGVAWPAWRQLVIDLQVRGNRIFTEGEAINALRAGIGVGVSF